MTISLIAAIGERNRVIGRNNGLPWSKRLRPDMQRFKQLTLGNPVIMGHRTQESIDPKHWPLEGRDNFVVSRDPKLELTGATVANSVFRALEAAKSISNGREIFVIGGQQVYRFAMPQAKRLYLTLVEEDVPGDTFFPEYAEFTVEIEREIVSDFEPRLTFLTLERP